MFQRIYESNNLNKEKSKSIARRSIYSPYFSVEEKLHVSKFPHSTSASPSLFALLSRSNTPASFFTKLMRPRLSSTESNSIICFVQSFPRVEGTRESTYLSLHHTEYSNSKTDSFCHSKTENTKINVSVGKLKSVTY